MTSQQAIAETTARSRVTVIKDVLMERQSEIAAVAGGDHSARRLIMSAVLAASTDPKIAECTPVSVARCVMQCAIMGLDLSSGLGEAYLVPFRDRKAGVINCTVMVGYRSWQRLAAEAGYTVIAEPVYEHDHFVFSKVPPRFEHTPCLKAADRGIFLGVYAVALRGDQVNRVEWVTPEDVTKARAMAERGRPSPAWKEWPDRMRRKLALSRLCRELTPERNSRLAKLIEVDQASKHGRLGDPDIDRATEVVAESVPDRTLDEGRQTFDAPPDPMSLPDWGFDQETGEVDSDAGVCNEKNGV